jgi:hypothetical protein
MRSCLPVQEPGSSRGCGIRLALAFILSAGLTWPAEAGQSGSAGVSEAAARVPTRIEGIVTDEAGRILPGARILALGATVALAETDRSGHFSLPVLAGEYILMAVRDGYVSARRVGVRAIGGVALRRDLALASLAVAAQAPSAGPATDDVPAEGPRETAWRLRYLPRSVLRDGMVPPQSADPDATTVASGRRSEASDLALWASDLTGRVDFLTTSALSATGPVSRPDWPRGVAYVAIGAPVGPRGDWTVHAAMAGGEQPAWTFAGEYRARHWHRHALRVGSTYSAQTLAGDARPSLVLPASAAVRRAGSVYASDRWQLTDDLAMTYAGHLDRFDYLAVPNLFGGSVALRHDLSSRLVIVAEASDQQIAPAAFEFRAPSASGIWLPPERTFSVFGTRRPIGAERVQRTGVGVAISLGKAGAAREAADRPSLSVWRVQERSADQIAVLFAGGGQRQTGHYYVGTVGSVAIDGWRIGAAGRIGRSARGRVDYAVTRALWTRAEGLAGRLAVDDPLGHDLTSSIDLTLPRAETVVSAMVRLSDGFRSAFRSEPRFGARFALEVRQPLPGRTLNLVVSARTLNNGESDRAGFYDELLTIAPPVRIAAGIEMPF